MSRMAIPIATALVTSTGVGQRRWGPVDHRRLVLATFSPGWVLTLGGC